MVSAILCVSPCFGTKRVAKSFKAFNEDIHLQEQKLMNVRVRCVVTDSIYATNVNRKFCTKYGISTSFVRKGRATKDLSTLCLYAFLEHPAYRMELPTNGKRRRQRCSFCHWNDYATLTQGRR